MDRSFLLQTKFLVPRHRGEMLPRPHLLERLDSAIDHRLTLISAPPGYGKTTLLAELAISTERSCAWYQLDVRLVPTRRRRRRPDHLSELFDRRFA
jgi:LuxR family maltose regulon positive regulatory protein